MTVSRVTVLARLIPRIDELRAFPGICFLILIFHHLHAPAVRFVKFVRVLVNDVSSFCGTLSGTDLCGSMLPGRMISISGRFTRAAGRHLV